MRHSVFVLPLTLVLLAACSHQAVDPVAEASKPFLAMPVETVDLGNNAQMVSGVGGNVLLLKGQDGALLVDDGVPARTEKLDEVAGGNVKTVINTHFHFDHTGGNVYFGSHGATIIAQDKVKERLSKPETIDFFKLTTPATEAAGLPKITFASHYELSKNGYNIKIVHLPRGAHTDTDSIVFVPQLKVVHTGDIFFNGVYPFIDYSNGGSLDGMIAATNWILAHSAKDTRYIAGHGKLASRADFVAYRNMLVDVRKHVAKLKAKGASEAEVVAAHPTAKYDAKWGHGLFDGDGFAKIAYRSTK